MKPASLHKAKAGLSCPDHTETLNLPFTPRDVTSPAALWSTSGNNQVSDGETYSPARREQQLGLDGGVDSWEAFSTMLPLNLARF